MAEDDIYGNKSTYEKSKNNIKDFLNKPKESENRVGRLRKYYCKNPDNIKHFEKLFNRLEAKDNSYIHRNRMISILKLICHATDKELSKIQDREDIDKIVAFAHTTQKTIDSKRDFIKHIKLIWKILFPEKDEKGRIDEAITPYVIRHLTTKFDKSKEKRKKDILEPEEVEQIIGYFSKDPRIQAWLSLIYFSYARPQELAYIKIRDCEIYDNYAKIWISEHGKEGVGFLEVIDNFYYISKWFNIHQYKKDKNSFLFYSNGDKKRPLTPFNVNKKLREAVKRLGINKRITNYSFKRSGITTDAIRGNSPTEIMHRARWSSVDQLRTYDYSAHEDTFKRQLAIKGKITDGKYKDLMPKTKKCSFCDFENGIAEEICNNKSCGRPLNREKIKQQIINLERIERASKILDRTIEKVKDKSPDYVVDKEKEQIRETIREMLESGELKNLE
ncbi:site-specific integrase [Candidatus Woesearchaeota archaeon]|nr:site-specific integrase [Candidatus Woesearchaeota archaeon]